MYSGLYGNAAGQCDVTISSVVCKHCRTIQGLLLRLHTAYVHLHPKLVHVALPVAYSLLIDLVSPTKPNMPCRLSEK